MAKRVIDIQLAISFCLVVFCACSIAADEEAPEKVIDPWKGSIQAGGVLNTGNSTTKNVNSKLTVDYENQDWDNLASIEGQISADRAGTTAESVGTNLEIRRLLWERGFVFAKLNSVYDRFATYDLTVRDALGLGYTIYKTPKWSISIEAGPGSAHYRIAGEKNFQHELIGNISAVVKFKISDQADFKQTVNGNIGERNINLKSISSIKTRMTKSLALEISYTIDHNTHIPAASKNRLKTDTISKVAVVYDF